MPRSRHTVRFEARAAGGSQDLDTGVLTPPAATVIWTGRADVQDSPKRTQRGPDGDTRTVRDAVAFLEYRHGPTPVRPGMVAVVTYPRSRYHPAGHERQGRVVAVSDAGVVELAWLETPGAS